MNSFLQPRLEALHRAHPLKAEVVGELPQEALIRLGEEPPGELGNHGLQPLNQGTAEEPSCLAAGWARSKASWARRFAWAALAWISSIEGRLASTSGGTSRAPIPSC